MAYPLMRRRITCPTCRGVLRLRLELHPALVFHPCRPRPRPSLWATPDPWSMSTRDEAWADAFESHSGGVPQPTREEAETETMRARFGVDWKTWSGERYRERRDADEDGQR